MDQALRTFSVCIGALVGIGGSVVVADQPAQKAAATASGEQALYSTFNGERYRVSKHWQGQEEIKLYTAADGRVFTQQELRDHVAQQEPQILTPHAQSLLSQAAPGEPLDLIVLLREQPAVPISRQLRTMYAAELDSLTEQIQAITRRTLPMERLTPAQKRAFVPQPLSDVDMAARRALAIERDALEQQMREEIYSQIAEAVQPSQAELADFIEGLGGVVTTRISAMNILGVRLPADRVEQLAAHPLVATIDEDKPGEPELDNQKYSLGLVTGFWADGIDGGVHDVGVLDTGVQQNHPYLSSHNFLSNMGPNDTGSHGTGMAGILASTHPNYRGMAYGLDTIVVARAGNASTSMAGMDYIASTGVPENVNYSFGNGMANNSDYAPIDQFFDGVIDTFAYMVSKSTGNGGWGVTTITHPAPAYNLLASANIYDNDNIPRDDDRIWSSSSTGPTLNGRKKPDIAAPGHNTMSTHPNGGFSNIGGTSSASPNTGGGIVLLYDMGLTNVMGAKAVLINTAEAMDNNGTSSTHDDFYVQGSRWNHRYGWGYLNLGQAYLHGLEVFLDEVADSPADADFKLYKGYMYQYEKATLVWQRHVAYNGATYPNQIEDLSDLDLFAYREADGMLLAESTSPIDNVEQLHVEEDGMVVLKVQAFGSFDPDVDVQEFALATQEQFVAVSGPAFATDFTHPTNVEAGATFQIDVQVHNTGDVRAHDISVELDGVAIVSGPNPAIIGSLDAGSFEEVSWTVQAPDSDGNYPISAQVISVSYGKNFTATGESAFLVDSCIGDLNGDGVVDHEDLSILLGAYGSTAGDPNWNPAADINGDGKVAHADLALLLTMYGQECP